MKGLLIKDFKLLLLQKKFFLLIFAISLCLILFANDVTFSLGFFSLVLSLFTLTTIGYDQFDNGNAFLFTLPFSRVTYILEKYCLGLILGIGAWIFMTVLSLLMISFRNTMPLTDVMLGAVVILPLILLFQSFMIPIQIKFGSEKGRIILIGLLGALIVLGLLIVQMMEQFFQIDLAALLDSLSIMNLSLVYGGFIAATILLWLISCKISIGFLMKMEF